MRWVLAEMNVWHYSNADIILSIFVGSSIYYLIYNNAPDLLSKIVFPLSTIYWYDEIDDDNQQILDSQLE